MGPGSVCVCVGGGSRKDWRQMKTLKPPDTNVMSHERKNRREKGTVCVVSINTWLIYINGKCLEASNYHNKTMDLHEVPSPLNCFLLKLRKIASVTVKKQSLHVVL